MVATSDVNEVKVENKCKTLINGRRLNNPKVGNIPNFEHETVLTDSKPFSHREYRVPNHLKDNLREIIKQLTEDDIIRPSASKFTSSALLVPKRNGKYRLVIDFRRLKNIVIGSTHV